MDFKIPYGKQQITEDDIQEVIACLKDDFLTQGPRIDLFEENFANYIGVKYAVAVSNATAGLHLAVLALDLKPGDKVITSPITFAASANCVKMAGGEVWLADIDPETYLLDIQSVKKLIESKPKGFFKGIIPVDFAGLPVNLEIFKELAKFHDLWIIEDAAHSPGGYFYDSFKNKQMCGNGNFAECAVFSFHPVKHIASGEGGMITTNSEAIYKKLRMLRTHGITKENMAENHGGWFYEMQFLGYNYRMTDIQAALGNSQLKRNPEGLKRRMEIAKKYETELKGLVKFQKLPDNSYNAHHLFVIEVENRKGLYDFLAKNNIFTQIHYIPIHYLPYYKQVGFGDASLLNAEKYYNHCLSLPMFPSLSDHEQDFVINKVKEFFNG